MFAAHVLHCRAFADAGVCKELEDAVPYNMEQLRHSDDARRVGQSCHEGKVYELTVIVFLGKALLPQRQHAAAAWCTQRSVCAPTTLTLTCVLCCVARQNAHCPLGSN